MRTFKAKCSEHTEIPPGTSLAYGIRAPGPMVLVVQEGTGWVKRKDGSRETIEAQSVVIFEAGDWFEYGANNNGNSRFKVDIYWETGLSEEEQKAIFAAIFGPDVTQ